MPINIEFHAGSLSLIVDKRSNKKSPPVRLPLTRSEFLVLKALVINSGTHLSKEHLFRTGWPDSYVGSNSLPMAIMSLRKKLHLIGDFWEISTIQRHGYSLNIAVFYRTTKINVTYQGEADIAE
ncbi:winged helix-turn-helix domain-containing protein [Vibrio campbellii]|uniref:winged helix-turn-helix domain-containing protein n=1 Tax=Vibrio campbellii TaxID=680 RepID=UPI0009B8AB44|nr:helix-turn-helix domain-containing protein [Vibrio campbellii]MCC8256027.1 helix-turn-helix domain-containing protein [Vibrio campbellii CAIM 333]UMM01754.1 helix-turn-helix domain-containing protein [Vibrio campbellii]